MNKIPDIILDEFYKKGINLYDEIKVLKIIDFTDIYNNISKDYINKFYKIIVLVNKDIYKIIDKGVIYDDYTDSIYVLTPINVIM